ncbi:MAG: hypothetical protein ACOCTS_01395 [Thermodesulfobacteriota bacterium]
MDTIYNFDQVPIGFIDYEETDHYRLYKSFMEDRQPFFDAD